MVEECGRAGVCKAAPLCTPQERGTRKCKRTDLKVGHYVSKKRRTELKGGRYIGGKRAIRKKQIPHFVRDDNQVGVG